MESLKNFGFALFFGSTAAFAAPPLIAIDVGHGGVDGGATSARGRPEFAFNREFAGVLAPPKSTTRPRAGSKAAAAPVRRGGLVPSAALQR